MALICCKECGQMISSVATSCPNCGMPQETFNTSDRTVKEQEEVVSSNYDTSSKSMPSNLVHCRECGEMISKSAQQCPKCGALQNGKVANIDKPSVGICVLSFLLPIVGVIIAFVKMNEEPQNAKEYRIWAVIGTVFSIFMQLWSTSMSQIIYNL